MTRFVGRHWELERLQELLKRPTASFVVVKGRRRIGKSRLIEEFAKDFKFVSVSGLFPQEKMTAQDQRDEFSRETSRILQIPFFQSRDWGDLFWNLSLHTAQGRVIILLDEITWLSHDDPTFLPKLKNAWDKYFKKNPELILIVCGSISSWIDKNILMSTGFVGRVDLELTLHELSLFECNKFWGKRREQISAYEKFKILSVTGGIPRYLEIITPQESAEYNIKRLCFTKSGTLYKEFYKIFNDLFGKRSPIYKDILECLVSSPLALEQIFECLKFSKGGTLKEYLDDLIESGFVQRDYCWSLKTKEQSKLSRFRISDNYIRFYLKYIAPNKDKIERNDFLNKTLTTLPGWDSIMGLQFENLVLNNRAFLWKKLNIDSNEVVNDNPYFQKGNKSNPGCQIDYMIQTRFNCLYIFEIKFSRSPLQKQIIHEVQSKISRLDKPANFSYRPVLIHVNGVDDEIIGSEFFANIINFSELLEIKE